MEKCRHMKSDLQIETARRNGSRSRGPVTAAGKARASRNRYTHGMLSKNIVIEGEESARFSALLDSLREEFRPATYLEESLVEDLAFCKWRQRRLQAMETACLSREIRLLDPVAAAESPAIRAVLALNSLAADANTLELINRYELRFDRQFNRILQRLRTLRAEQKTIPAIRTGEVVENKETQS